MIECRSLKGASRIKKRSINTNRVYALLDSSNTNL